jgi:hypothetical protein
MLKGDWQGPLRHTTESAVMEPMRLLSTGSTVHVDVAKLVRRFSGGYRIVILIFPIMVKGASSTPPIYRSMGKSAFGCRDHAEYYRSTDRLFSFVGRRGRAPVPSTIPAMSNA